MTLHEIHVGLTASFTLNELKRELEESLLNSSGPNQNIILGQFNNFAAAMSGKSFSPDYFIDFECHLYFLEDIFPNNFEKYLSGETIETDFMLQSIENAVTTLVNRVHLSHSKIILCLDSKISLSTLDFVNFQQKKRLSSFLTQMNNRIEFCIAKSKNILYLNFNDLVRKQEFGFNIDWRKEFLYKNPLDLKVSRDLAYSLSNVLSNIKNRKQFKVLALDCDNTLWGGVIGEDGISNICLGEDYPGRCYKKFQYDLLNLKNSGFLLCLLSKNNLSEVKEVFESHDGMVLKWSDISAYRINWTSKYLNLMSLADELNLGLDSFIFIDDSPVEIEEMKQMLPAVKSIQIPSDLENLPMLFEGIQSLNPWIVTAEDSSRTDMMIAEKERAQLLSKTDKFDFLEQLNLELNLSVFQPQDFERVSQLVMKTNQFNFTAKRLSLAELDEFLNQKDKTAVVARLRDRFGNYGIIGVILFEDLENQIVRISNFIVSCRALGRGVEMSMFYDSMLNFVQENQMVKIDRFQTDRNIPAFDFLNEVGLMEDIPYRRSEIEKKISIKQKVRVVHSWTV